MIETYSIHVPKYVADVFGRKLSTEDQASTRIKMMIERVYKLIEHALNGLSNSDWIISNTKYRSAFLNEPYGIETDGVMTYLYAEERGKKSPIAVFKDITLGAEYFVWLVSKGQRAIDWELFLDMDS